MVHPQTSSLSPSLETIHPPLHNKPKRKNPIEMLPFLTREGVRLADAVAHSLSSQSGSDRAFMRSFVADRVKTLYATRAQEAGGNNFLPVNELWQYLSTFLIFNPEKIRIDTDKDGIPNIIRCEECQSLELAFVRIKGNREYGQFTVLSGSRIVGFCNRCLRNNRKRSRLLREKGGQSFSLCFFPLAKAIKRRKRIRMSLRKSPGRKSRGRRFMRFTHLLRKTGNH